MSKGGKIALGYIAAALATFGVAAEQYQRSAWARYSVCATVAAQPGYAGDDCRAPWPIDATFVGLASGLGWPLYWSWEVARAALSDNAEEAGR